MNFSINPLEAFNNSESVNNYIQHMERPFKKKHSVLILALFSIGMIILLLAYNTQPA